MADLPGPDGLPYDELAARLALAEDTLDAIARGAVDALVINTPAGPRVYTLQGADEFYRALVEQMAEGAAAVHRDGTILYANEALARMLAVPLESVIGSDLTNHVAGLDRDALVSLFAGGGAIVDAELRLGRDGVSSLDVSLSAREIEATDGTNTMCLIVSDRTQHRQAEAAARRAELATERARVARDLHDVVIQSLFAIGLRLHGLSRQVDDEHGALLHAIVEQVDDTVSAIRATIFGLRTDPGVPDLEAGIRRLVDETPAILGFAADLIIVGSLTDAAVDDRYVDITAALREALANAARHANATRVTVEVSTTDDEFVLRILDNGKGLGPAPKQSGLANLRTRAESLGGSCTVETNAGQRGTCVTWRIPVGTAAPRAARPVPSR